jgi:large subunit ribosomal protein L21
MLALNRLKAFGQVFHTFRSQENALYRLSGLIQSANRAHHPGNRNRRMTRGRHDDFLKEPTPIPYAGRLPRTFEQMGGQEYPQEAQFSAEAVIAKVNNEIKTDTQSRLFAVIHIAGKQFKITTEDIIIIQGMWAPDVGDRIRLEKVLLAGSPSYTLVGRPLLPRDLVKIEGTVIEKTLSHTQIFFFLKKRKNTRRLKFDRTPLSMIRINSIDVVGLVDEFKEVEGLRPNVVV